MNLISSISLKIGISFLNLSDKTINTKPLNSILNHISSKITIMGGVNLAKKKEIFEVFFRRKPAMILMALRKGTKNRYGSVLAKEVDCTYSHAVKILQEMEKSRLVNFEKMGRIKTIKLTENGNRVAESIEKIKELL
jgi:predicted transcriptional regulator